MWNRHRISGNIGWALAIGFVLLVLSGSAADAQERESPPSRPLPADTRAPSPPPSPPPPSPSPPDTGGGGHHHGGGYRYPRHHRYGYWGFGYYWPYSRFYWHYPYPYYPWGMVWYPAYTSDTRVGALDLAVKPKRVEVWVDGQYVGNAGKFDGYPGYLWLAEGSHKLVFYRQGWQTVERRLVVQSGPVRKLRLQLVEGPSTAPEELFKPAAPAARTATAERTEPPRDRRERSAQLDLRGEPGRFRLEVAPLDASVYLDGRFLGTGEELSRLHSGMMVDPGEHFIEVQRPGYRTERVSFSVEAGDETEVKVALSAGEASER